MAELNFSPPVKLPQPANLFADSKDSTFNMTQIEGSEVLRKSAKKLIIALPLPSNTTQATLGEPCNPRIVSQEPAEMTVIIRASKSFLNLNARPPINMEEEMRLSVLRHKNAEEDEAMKVKEEDEAMKVEEEAVEQNALNGAPFDLEDSIPLAIRTRTVDASSAQVTPAEPEMYVIREALISVTKQMFLDDKYGAKASTIRFIVREQLHLPRGFFNRNGWPRRSNIIIFQAFSDARVSLLPH